VKPCRRSRGVGGGSKPAEQPARLRAFFLSDCKNATPDQSLCHSVATVAIRALILPPSRSARIVMTRCTSNPVAQCGHGVACLREALVMLKDAFWIIFLACASLAAIGLVMHVGDLLP
jgi:hypothetical protein